MGLKGRSRKGTTCSKEKSQRFMKILFFCSSTADYLSDSLLHGLRTVYGSDCVDYPKCEILYENCPKIFLDTVRGKGFTLYTGLLKDIEVDRYDIEDKIKRGYFDLIIISDIQRHFGWFVQFRPWLTSKNTIILDGADTYQPYAARGHWWRRPYYWFLPSAHKEFLYFKREWTPETTFTLPKSLLPMPLRRLLPKPSTMRRVSFGIPKEKIVTEKPSKIKDFPVHIVDKELVDVLGGSTSSYAFESETAYYTDLQQSRFGITTKRAGWDCLRHYEIAANGAVPCFRELHKKPETCAPHGLTEENTIFYNSASDLMDRIARLSQADYLALQTGAIAWANANSTEQLAKQVVAEFKRSQSI